MKIELDLTRDEAHELNYLIAIGAASSKGKRVSRVVAFWNEAYLKGMSE